MAGRAERLVSSLRRPTDKAVYAAGKARGTIVAVKRRGKRIAISIAFIGIVAIAVAGWAAKDFIWEEWYLRDLETYDEGKSKTAAEWLGDHGSARTMRRLADLARKLVVLPDAKDISSGTCSSLIRIGQAQEAIAVKRRTAVVPVLIALLHERPPHPPPRNEVRIGAANFLGKIGPDARDAIPALREALTDGEERFRRHAAKALKRIEGEAE